MKKIVILLFLAIFYPVLSISDNRQPEIIVYISLFSGRTDPSFVINNYNDINDFKKILSQLPALENVDVNRIHNTLGGFIFEVRGISDLPEGGTIYYKNIVEIYYYQDGQQEIKYYLDKDYKLEILLAKIAKTHSFDPELEPYIKKRLSSLNKLLDNTTNTQFGNSMGNQPPTLFGESVEIKKNQHHGSKALDTNQTSERKKFKNKSNISIGNKYSLLTILSIIIIVIITFIIIFTRRKLN